MSDHVWLNVLHKLVPFLIQNDAAVSRTHRRCSTRPSSNQLNETDLRTHLWWKRSIFHVGSACLEKQHKVLLRLRKLFPLTFCSPLPYGKKESEKVHGVITKKYGQVHPGWILTAAARCLSEKLTRDFYTMTICRVDPTTTGATLWGAGGTTKKSLLALKASEFASPAIKTVLIPNTNMDSVKHKQRKLLTNTLALGINHMHAQTNKQCAKTQT